ncbi:aKG-HExxH-type peptide beta-hydroxylase [Nitrosovibrio tenuis]|uniref:HEXXH motif-containing protein n=1 Tax=Nitrosovibrio tenuis TaxID=1233 RepID=A0A1H7P5F7_9PROT|nr:HEXXH motif-containing putative peptide modification protein [Nitrosovibrio tenuis]SEL31100.1 HEXXH motif-containing protein [Nitrosovibrio tenuis]
MNAEDARQAGSTEPFLKYVLNDCAGLCYPSAPGNTVDVLFGLAALRRAERWRHQLDAAVAAADSSEAQLAQRAIAVLGSLFAGSRARLFSTPLAEIDTVPCVDRADFSRLDEKKRVLSGIRNLLHHPDVRNIAFVLPPCLFTDGAFYLPHAHALLFSGPPEVTIAVVESEGNTRFTWSDGLTLTLPNDGSRLPSGFSHSRLKPLPHIGGFPVLNSIAETAPLLSGFGPAADHEIGPAAERIEAALELLSQVWPLAYHALQRHVQALCILKQRSYSRSHSPSELPGTIFMSADDIERIGDLLCHESSHVRMNVFRLYDPLAAARTPESEAAGFTSPWRPDLRPLRGLLDGVHAFLNVCRYHRRLGERLSNAWASAAIYQRQKRNIIQASMTLRQHAIPTRLGAMLLEEFSREEALL